jgi:hypothetical protein
LDPLRGALAYRISALDVTNPLFKYEVECIPTVMS